MNVGRIDAEYCAALADQISYAVKSGVNDFDEMLEHTMGAFPSDVAKVARRLFPEWKSELAAENLEWSDRIPHPSPAHGEFYFTPASSRQLAELGQGRTLCLGTPSVAVEIAASLGFVRLVDSSPWLHERFGLKQTSVEHLDGQAVEAFDEVGAFDVAIIDPPWYFPALLDWINVASRSVRQGGHIFMPLAPPLTRPGAGDDATQLVRLGNRIGRSEITPMVASYEPSRFERRAIGRSGGTVTRPWRRARILHIENVDPQLGPAMEAPTPTWIDRRAGASIISIDPSRPKLDAASDEFYIFDNVSRRDDRIRRANVWTSESTGALVRDPESLLKLIDLSEQSDRSLSSLREVLNKLELGQ